MKKTLELGAMDRNRAGWKNLFRTKQRKPLVRKPSESQNQNQHKLVLFKLEESEISVYKPLGDTNEDLVRLLQFQSPSLISQGRFVVYKMHQNGTHYLQCGEVIHPILPNARVIKVNSDTYILPMRNPNRYWKLSLNLGHESADAFEAVIKRICKFQVDEVDFHLASPFNSFVADDSSLSAGCALHHPQPVTSSAPSMKSSLLLNDDSLSLSINSIGRQLEIELDNELNKSGHQESFNNSFKLPLDDDMDDLDDTLVTFERREKPSSRGNKLTNRFSLTFKSIDFDESMAIEEINKFSGDEIKNIIQMEPQGVISRYLFG